MTNELEAEQSKKLQYPDVRTEGNPPLAWWGNEKATDITNNDLIFRWLLLLSITRFNGGYTLL